ncbi:hypothetical protein PIB30_077735 [Stylosanthes scabra]|uniref:Uncharacterized protein n=1 Tax=Stylosanthes scabra TaxID=79078 RepID=A0ABU6RQY7_9FABA|nr:hypothetical protein [Stylosanthes scabra]
MAFSTFSIVPAGILTQPPLPIATPLPQLESPRTDPTTTCLGPTTIASLLKLLLFPLPLDLFPCAILPFQIFDFCYNIMMHTLLHTNLPFFLQPANHCEDSIPLLRCQREGTTYEGDFKSSQIDGVADRKHTASMRNSTTTAMCTKGGGSGM